MARYACLFAWLVTALVLVGGCSRGPRLVNVTGVVQLDGKPLPDASVLFVFSEHPRPAVGRTNASGEFSLAYLNRAGAPIGACTAVIHKPGPNGQESIPARFNSSSQLKYEVTKNGPNHFNIELKMTSEDAAALQEAQQRGQAEPEQKAAPEDEYDVPDDPKADDDG